MPIFLLSIAIIVQLVCAILALNLPRKTERVSAWLFIAVAILLMAFHCIGSLCLELYPDMQQAIKFFNTSVVLIISILLLMGIIGIRPLFRRMLASGETELKQTRAEVEKLSIRLMLALKSGQIGTWDLDVKGDFLAWDSRMYTLYGIDQDSFGSDYEAWKACVYPDDVNRVDAEVKKAMESKQEFDTAFRILRPDGSVRYIKAAAIVQHESDGTPIRMVGMNYDITQQKQIEIELRESKKDFQLAVEAAQAGKVVYDCVRDILTYDDRCIAIFGLPKKTVYTYADWRSIVHPDDIKHVEERYEEQLTNENSIILHYRIIRPDNKEVRYIWSVTNIQCDAAGKAFRLSGLSFDETDEKMAAKELSQAKISAEKANLAKSTFLANMSHEIRNPINAILGFSQILQLEQINPDQREYLSDIDEASEHLLSLINDVLDISKIEAGIITAKPTIFSLEELLHSIEAMFSMQLNKQKMNLHVLCPENAPEFINTDQGKLRQILANLVSNAIKFSGGKDIKLLVDPENTTNQIAFEVEDAGSGIPSEDLELIFEAFGQSEQGRETEGGTGLGLAISRQYAKLLKGSLTVTSKIGEGSTFRLVIKTPPIHEQQLNPDPAKQQIYRLRPGQLNNHILVADDDKPSRNILRKMLEPAGFNISEASNGQAAVDSFIKNQPDLILMDIKMPVLNGLEATRKIRQHPAGQKIPIFAITAGAFEEEQQSIKRAGVDAILHKPYRYSALFEKIVAHSDYQLQTIK